MAEPIFHYDEQSDTLHVSFAPGEAATGIALNDHMLLRINKHERRAIGLTLFAYSVLAQPTEVGPPGHSAPSTGMPAPIPLGVHAVAGGHRAYCHATTCTRCRQ